MLSLENFVLNLISKDSFISDEREQGTGEGGKGGPYGAEVGGPNGALADGVGLRDVVLVVTQPFHSFACPTDWVDDDDDDQKNS